MAPNTQLIFSAGVTVGVLKVIRDCSPTAFALGVCAPALAYALLGERTKATRLRGKVVLVTGASSGLGLALAIEAARRGATRVVLMSRTRATLEKAAEAVRAAASDANFAADVVPCDVSDPAAVRAALPALRDVDVLVNNAGAGAWKHVEETAPEEAAAMMACPYGAAFTLTALLVPGMKARAARCHVLNVTSAASEAAFRGAVGYGVARWAMRGFSRMLGWDLAELRIGVTHLDAAEITGTDYFSDAPGKAGAASHAKIPSIFKFVDRLGVNYSTTAVASAAFDGVEKGWATIHVPGFIVLPFKMLNDIIPCAVEALCAVGPAGRRAN